MVHVSIESGDILLFSRPCLAMDPLSAFICTGAKLIAYSSYDHVAIAVENPETKKFFCLEANMNGVTLHPLIDRLSRTSAREIVVRKLIPPSSPSTTSASYESAAFKAKLWQYATENASKKYNSSLQDLSMSSVTSHTLHSLDSVVASKKRRALQVAHTQIHDCAAIRTKLCSDQAAIVQRLRRYYAAIAQRLSSDCAAIAQ
jgi:hypothetical protein